MGEESWYPRGEFGSGQGEGAGPRVMGKGGRTSRSPVETRRTRRRMKGEAHVSDRRKETVRMALLTYMSRQSAWKYGKGTGFESSYVTVEHAWYSWST
jgi:hypothetical protein